MDFSEIVCISNMPGLYQIHKKRNDGLIVFELPNKPPKFISSRNHVFTPLDNITIYTDDEPIELKTVFENMKKYSAKNAIPSPKASNDELKSFFVEVVDNYDDDKVYVSDIKKVIKWYSILDNNGMLDEKETKKEKEDSNAKSEVKEDKADKETKKTTKATKKTTKKTTKSTKNTKA